MCNYEHICIRVNGVRKDSKKEVTAKHSNLQKETRTTIGILFKALRKTKKYLVVF